MHVCTCSAIDLPAPHPWKRRHSDYAVMISAELIPCDQSGGRDIGTYVAAAQAKANAVKKTKLHGQKTKKTTHMQSNCMKAPSLFNLGLL